MEYFSNEHIFTSRTGATEITIKAIDGETLSIVGVPDKAVKSYGFFYNTDVLEGPTIQYIGLLRNPYLQSGPTNDFSKLMDAPNEGRIIYTGEDTKIFSITYVLSSKCSGNVSAFYFLAINNILSISSYIRTAMTTRDKIEISSLIVSLSKNDYIDLKMYTGIDYDQTLSNYQITIVEV